MQYCLVDLHGPLVKRDELQQLFDQAFRNTLNLVYFVAFLEVVAPYLDRCRARLELRYVCLIDADEPTV